MAKTIQRCIQVTPTVEWVTLYDEESIANYDEVYVGATDPGAGYELWYDTDADASDSETYEIARWNSAWGIVALGTLNVMSNYALTSTTLINLSSPLTVTLLAGRRYEFEARFHAVGGTAGGGINLALNGLATNDTWSYVTSPGWTHASINAQVVGTGAAVTVTLQGKVAAAGTIAIWAGDGNPASYFLCRDAGPVAGSIAPVTPSGWNSLTLTSGWTQKASCELATYCKVQNTVKVRGVVDFNTTAGNPMATLPSGFRPALNVRQGTSWVRTSDGLSFPLGIEVYPTGAINIMGLNAVGYHDINVEFYV